MTIVSIFRGGGFGNLAGWYSYFFGTIIRHTRVASFECVHSKLIEKVVHVQYAYPTGFYICIMMTGEGGF